jgi:hypothetical protein
MRCTRKVLRLRGSCCNARVALVRLDGQRTEGERDGAIGRNRAAELLAEIGGIMAIAPQIGPSGWEILVVFDHSRMHRRLWRWRWHVHICRAELKALAHAAGIRVPLHNCACAHGHALWSIVARKALIVDQQVVAELLCVE